MLNESIYKRGDFVAYDGTPNVKYEVLYIDKVYDGSIEKFGWQYIVRPVDSKMSDRYFFEYEVISYREGQIKKLLD